MAGRNGGGAYPPTYSPSKLKLAAECPAKYAFSYVHKLPFPSKVKVKLGLWMDEAANFAWAEKLETGQPADPEKAVERARAAFEEQVVKACPEWDLDDAPEVVRDRVLVAFGEFMRTWHVRLVPAKVQAWCGLPAGVVGTLGLRGRLDLLTREPEGLVVNDLKVRGAVFYSVSSGQPGPKILAEISRDIQLMSYAASVAEEGEAPVKVRWIGLIWTKNPQVQPVELPVTANLIRWYLQAARGAARTIDSGYYPPNPTATYCGTCDYGKECMEKYGSAE